MNYLLFLNADKNVDLKTKNIKKFHYSNVKYGLPTSLGRKTNSGVGNADIKYKYLTHCVCQQHPWDFPEYVIRQFVNIKILTARKPNLRKNVPRTPFIACKT